MRSERVPEEPKMSPKTLLGPCGPILAYFGGGQAQIFSKSFWAKKGQKIFFQKFFYLHYFESQRVWDPQNPKIDPVDPPVDPILAQFVGKKAKFGVKNAFFSKKFCCKSFFVGSRMVWDPQKPKIGPLYPPMDPIWACTGTSGRHATRLVSHIRAQPYLAPIVCKEGGMPLTAIFTNSPVYAMFPVPTIF